MRKYVSRSSEKSIVTSVAHVDPNSTSCKETRKTVVTVEAPLPVAICRLKRHHIPIHSEHFYPFLTTVGQTAPVVPARLPVQDLAHLLAPSERKPSSVVESILIQRRSTSRHEQFSKIKNATDSAILTDNVKLKYLRTPVTGKANTAIVEFAYCGTLYQNPVRMQERKFDEQHAVVSAYFDKLTQFPALRTYFSENFINSCAAVLALVGVF